MLKHRHHDKVARHAANNQDLGHAGAVMSRTANLISLWAESPAYNSPGQRPGFWLPQWAKPRKGVPFCVPDVLAAYRSGNAPPPTSDLDRVAQIIA